ncbi:MAG TPA: MFS transporter, partial [Candidatus Eisenbacteria bacterium]|nr:MFS transporter [Candidatus Eisenbacteria bacterium]
QVTRNPLAHLVKTVGQGRYLLVFLATIFMTTGGFMLMPFASAFSVNNLKIDLDHLPWVYLAAGVSSFAAGPLLGRLSDGVGKYRLFSIGSFVSIAMVLVYCRLGETPLAWVIAIHVLLYGAIGARMISSQALVSEVPELAERGAFMAANGSVAQLSGGVAAAVAGLIVVQRPGEPLEHYDVLGWLVTIAALVTVGLLYPIQKMVSAKLARAGLDSRLASSGPPESDAPAQASAR